MTRQLLASLALVALAGCGVPPDRGGLPGGSPTTNAGTPTTRSEQRRATAGKESATVGPIKAEVVSWTVEKPRRVKGGTLDKEYVVVRVRFSTADDTVAKSVFVFLADAKDEYGNEYQFSNTVGYDLVGDEQSGSVRAGQPVSVVLLFDVPIPKATRLDIDIPAVSAGLDDKEAFRFTIPLK